tara:strand:- start:228 stop:350 length:123 start_codon:yes stop_codon:yes gene_type:complete
MEGVGVHEVVIESPDAMQDLADLDGEHVAFSRRVRPVYEI